MTCKSLIMPSFNKVKSLVSRQSLCDRPHHYFLPQTISSYAGLLPYVSCLPEGHQDAACKLAPYKFNIRAHPAYLEVWRWVGGRSLCFPVVKAEVSGFWHNPLFAIKVGLHVFSFQSVWMCSKCAASSTCEGKCEVSEPCKWEVSGPCKCEVSGPCKCEVSEPCKCEVSERCKCKYTEVQGPASCKQKKMMCCLSGWVSFFSIAAPFKMLHHLIQLWSRNCWEGS